MAEEGKITMSEFKTVVERFEANQKKIVEIMNYRFDRLEDRMTRQEKRSDAMMEQIALLHEGQTKLEQQFVQLHEGQTGLKKQFAQLHKGQTEIKAELKSELKNRVTYKDFRQLEKRVVRLENRIT